MFFLALFHLLLPKFFSQMGLRMDYYDGFEPNNPLCDKAHSIGYTVYYEFDFCYVYPYFAVDSNDTHTHSEEEEVGGNVLWYIETTSLYEGEGMYHAWYDSLEDCEEDRARGVDLRESVAATQVEKSPILLETCEAIPVDTWGRRGEDDGGIMALAELLRPQRDNFVSNFALQLEGEEEKKEERTVWTFYYTQLEKSFNSFIQSLNKGTDPHPSSSSSSRTDRSSNSGKEGIVYIAYYRDVNCETKPNKFVVADMKIYFHVDGLTCTELEALTGPWSEMNKCRFNSPYEYSEVAVDYTRMACGDLSIWDEYIGRGWVAWNKFDMKAVFGTIMVIFFIGGSAVVVLIFFLCMVYGARKNDEEVMELDSK